MLGTCHLGKDNSNHESLGHHAKDGLHAHHEDRFGTFFGRCSDTITDRVLRLDGEEETGRKVFDVVDTRCPVVVS